MKNELLYWDNWTLTLRLHHLNERIKLNGGVSEVLKNKDAYYLVEKRKVAEQTLLTQLGLPHTVDNIHMLRSIDSNRVQDTLLELMQIAEDYLLSTPEV